MPLSKPERAKPRPRKRRTIGRGFDDAVLAAAAERARYTGSPYHRPPGSKMGQSAGRSYPHASKCDPIWTAEMANRALKNAIRRGLVSEEWRNDLPRYAWHLEDDTVYEAVLTNQGTGEYHAYPLSEEQEWPKDLEFE
jgi:hypothetical protein